jgi:hypothetical protein
MICDIPLPKSAAGSGGDSMANSWTIEITKLPNGDVGFRVALPGNVVGQALGASNGDNVTWYNKTDDTLTLQSIDPAGVYLTDPIPPGEASDPIFPVNGSLKYACVHPSQQQHSIVVPATT